MSIEDAQIPDIKELGAALDSDAIERASRAINSPICDAAQKAIGSSQMSGIGARMTSVLESSGAMKTLSDTATHSFKFDAPDPPRLAALDYATPNYTIPDLSSSLVEGCRTDWQQLIVIGNGFDLQCGLQSRFGDFFRPRFDEIASIPDYKRETWRTLLENSSLTLWDFILEANIDSL